MKTIHKLAVYLLYVVSLPVVVIFTAVMLILAIVGNLRMFGKADVVMSIKALFEGYAEGHKMNMKAIDELWLDHDNGTV